jgi:hypothetical protein
MKTVTALWTMIQFLPTLLVLITKAKEVFGSEQMKEFVQSVVDLLRKVASSAPTADSAGTKPANIEEEKRRRWFQYKNRIKVAELVSDSEAREICYQNNTVYHDPNYELA